MKKITLKIVLTIVMTVITGITYGQDNLISLTPNGTGSEGNMFFNDSSTLNIDAAGVVTYFNSGANDDYTITSSGVVTLAGALNQTFVISTKGGLVMDDTPGADFGKIITQGGIDRAGAGDLGIRPGASGVNNGIEPLEGFTFGFDATNFTADVTIHITGVSFSGITASTGEEATIVNRLDTTKTLVTQSDTGNDISALELYITGGTAKTNIMSVFHSGTPNAFRVNGITFEIRNTATLSTEDVNSAFSNNFSLGQNPVSDIISINYNSNNVKEFKASLIDLNGRVIAQKISKNATTSNNIKFDSSALSSGMYFIRITSDTRIATKKVIKK